VIPVPFLEGTLTVKEGLGPVSNRLTIDIYYYDEDDPIMYRMDNVIEKLRRSGEDIDKIEVRYSRRDQPRGDAEESLPGVVYSLGDDKRIEFIGETSDVSLFWKAVSLLRPFVPSVRRRNKASLVGNAS
jgi:hypothetical protein